MQSEGQTKGQTEGQTEGRTERQTEGQTVQRQANIGVNTSETTQRFPRNTQAEVVHNVDDSFQTAGEDGPYKGRAVSATLHLFTTTSKQAGVV